MCIVVDCVISAQRFRIFKLFVTGGRDDGGCARGFGEDKTRNGDTPGSCKMSVAIHQYGSFTHTLKKHGVTWFQRRVAIVRVPHSRPSTNHSSPLIEAES